jgi:glucose-6-phosphate isomerase
MRYELSGYESIIANKIFDLEAERIIDRIWAKDFTVWGNEPDEIANRLGWLDCPAETLNALNEITEFVDEIRNEGFTDVLLMGMGGSSLAPEVFSLMFGKKKDYLRLHVLDSTHPGALLEYTRKLKPAKTLYIVSTKSGGTVETISFMKYFYNLALDKLGKDKVGNHFTAITDPGSGLEKMAEDLKFKKIFLNDPDIGGRYSALSFFGTVPAALIGVDLSKLLSRASEMADVSKISDGGISKNTAAVLGAIIGLLALEGKDKLTFISSGKFAHFGVWVEQLIAESTGKIGKGILPVVSEPLDAAKKYSDDRVFVYLKWKSNSVIENKIDQLAKAGHPVIEIEISDLYDIGKEFFRWEFATAVAGWVMGIQPFDQPNVEQAKVLARKMLKQYQETGKLPELKPSIETQGIKIYSDAEGKNAGDVLNNFLSQSIFGISYVSIQAYLKPDNLLWDELQKFRKKILKTYKVPTTIGYGPRFLHSTGQLHKGDAGNGLFIQLISDEKSDVQIPDEAGKEKSTVSFGALIKSQALGDRQALLDNNRKVLTIDLGKNPIENLMKVTIV